MPDKSAAERKKAQKAEDARIARLDYDARQTAIDQNMLRLRAERLAREAAESNQIKKKKKGRTLPETQGEKTRPAQSADASKAQNESDRP